VATTLATGVITHLISELRTHPCVTPAPQPSSMDIIVIEHALGTRLLLVNAPA
jgi:hypothetical protein